MKENVKGECHVESKKIGFIGTGVMGASIVKHLLNAGHALFIEKDSRAYQTLQENIKKLI